MKILSKIKLLAIFACVIVSSLCLSACSKLEPDAYKAPEKQPKVYGDITIDGVLSDGEWDLQEKFIYEAEIGGVLHNVEISSKFVDEGVLMYAKVTGAPVFFNPSRGVSENSGLEIYVAPGGVTTTNNNAWQIEIFSTGFYQANKYTYFNTGYGYRQVNKYIEVVGSTIGELNSADSEGYIMEYLLSYDLLGLTEAPSYISFDAAVIYCPDYVGQRGAWYSLRQNSGLGYSFVNPSTWYNFTKYGYMDEAGEVFSSVNNGGAVENGSVSVEGSFKGGTTVTVTPDDGYVLKSLKVNGVSVDALCYKVLGNSARVLDIEVEFKPISGNPLEITVKNGFAYTTAKLAKEGTPVTLKNSEGEIFAGVTDESGKAIIYAPDGEYSVIQPGYSSTSLTVSYNTSGSNAYEAIFNKAVLSSVGTGATLTENFGENGANVTSNGASLVKKLLSGFGASENIDFTGKVVLDYTYFVQTYTKTCTFIRWNHQNGSFYNNQVAWSNNNYLQIKKNEEAVKNLPSNVDGGAEYNLVYVVDGSTVTAYLKTDNGFEYLFTNEATSDIIGFSLESVENEGEFAYKNVKIYDGEFAEEYANALVNVLSAGETTIDAPASVSLGEEFNITITPKDAETGFKNVITLLKINGEAVDYVLNADGSASVILTHDGNITTYDIEVETEVKQVVPVSFKVSGMSKTGEAVDLTGVTVLVKGPVTSPVVIGENGLISIDLTMDGDYTLSAVGYISATFTVVNGDVDDIVLHEEFFANNNGFTYGYNDNDGYWITTNTHKSKIELKDKSIAVGDVIAFTYEADVVVGAYNYSEIQLYSSTGHFMTPQFTIYNGVLYFKDNITGNSTALARNVEDYKQSFYIVLEVGKAVLYTAEGEYVSAATGVKGQNSPLTDFAEFIFYYETETGKDAFPWKMSNIRVLKDTEIETEIEIENATAEIKIDGSVSEALSFGRQAEIRLTPNNGYAISSVTINGESVAPIYDANGLFVRYTPTSFDPVTVVVGTEVQTEVLNIVTINLKRSWAYGSVEKVPEDVVVSFTSGGKTSSAAADANGNLIIGLADKEYVVSCAGYVGATLTINSVEALSYDLTLTRIVVSGEGDCVVSDNENGAVIEFNEGDPTNNLANPSDPDNYLRYYYLGESVDWSNLAVIEYEITVQLNTPVYTLMSFRTAGRNDPGNTGMISYINHGSWTNKQTLEVYVGGGSKVDLGESNYTLSTVGGKTCVKVKIVAVSTGSNISYYYTNGDGVLTLLAKVGATDITNVLIRLDNNEGFAKYEGLKIYDGNEATARLTALGISA